MYYISQGPPSDLQFWVMGVKVFLGSSSAASSSMVIAFFSLPFELSIVTFILLSYILLPFVVNLLSLNWALIGLFFFPSPWKGRKGFPCHAWNHASVYPGTLRMMLWRFLLSPSRCYGSFFHIPWGISWHYKLKIEQSLGSSGLQSEVESTVLRLDKDLCFSGMQS